MIKAIIFDMDGVIFDTKNVYYKAVEELFMEKYRKKVTRDDYKNLFGKLDEYVLKELLKKFKLKGNIGELRKKKKELVQNLERRNLRIFPGAKKVLKETSGKYKTALVSSTWKKIIENALDEFDIRKYFSAVIGKEDIKKHKPDPGPYLTAAKRLGVKPSECIVVEDSVVGVESGKRAGMKVIAVMTSYSANELKRADSVVKSIADIKV